MNKKRIVLWLLLAAWMVVIFSFSAMAAPASDGLSEGITEKTVKVFMPQYDELTRQEQTIILEKMNFAIRKLAHASEFAVLGILAAVVLFSYPKKLRFQIIIALLICAAYAASDEAHQILVSGRSPQITDVLIDTGGAAIGIALVILIARRRLRKQKPANS